MRARPLRLVTDRLVRRTQLVEAVHEVVTARGWTTDRGPEHADPVWVYPASYRGLRFQEFEDLSPMPLACWIQHGDDPGWVFVEQAGNVRGCRRHTVHTHLVVVDDDPGPVLRTLLDSLEPTARALDPRALVDCRFFGDCAPGRPSTLR